jgi:hypothetical protein
MQSAAELQPQAAPPMHACPTPTALQSKHKPPAAPHVVAPVPGLHVVPLQQPPLHGCVPLHVVVQACAVVSQALPSGQSAVAMQPHAPITHAWPLVAAEQSRQALPAAPHVVAMVPALQVVPAQQPPLHGCEPLHALVHACVVRLHAEPIAQSPVALQPHLPPPATISHTAPLGLDAHMLHAPPLAPQLAGSVPGTHAPDAQQPPLHGCSGLQLGVHRCSAPSHASPTLQSAALMQPQVPPLQRWPALEVVQSTHAPPGAPHALAALPAAQVPFEQQAPLHGAVAEHMVEHKCVVVLHAAPDGQSPDELQPHAPPPATTTHAPPMLLPEQLWHAPPDEPHAIEPVPPTHAPARQQPPLHADCVAAPHAVPHTCFMVSHACPDGQSAAELQPQLPITHAWPAPDEVQSRHALPLAPQVIAAPPALQVPPAQQPPLHGDDGEQLLVHACMVVSHA